MMICGTIGAGYDWWSGTYGTRSKDVKAYLDAHPDEEVDIAVSSPGGYVDEGLTIYQLIKDHKHVNVHILGMTASIATVLCMGAKHVDMSVGSTMLIHNASTGVAVWESANKAKLDELIKDWQKQRDGLDTIDKVIASVYAQKSGKTSDEILAQMEKGSWLSPQQALEMGWLMRSGTWTRKTRSVRLISLRDSLTLSAPTLVCRHFLEQPLMTSPLKHFSRRLPPHSEICSRIIHKFLT